MDPISTSYRPRHTVEHDYFYQKSACIMQFTLGRYLVQIWSRTTPKTSPNEIRLAHRVVSSQITIKFEAVEEAGIAFVHAPLTFRAQEGY